MSSTETLERLLPQQVQRTAREPKAGHFPFQRVPSGRYRGTGLHTAASMPGAIFTKSASSAAKTATTMRTKASTSKAPRSCFSTPTFRTFELLEGERTGYFCIFREAFFTEKLRGPSQNCPCSHTTANLRTCSTNNRISR